MNWHRSASIPALWLSLATMLGICGCGEVKTIETEFTPSLGRFTDQVQPVLDAQTCGRGPDAERGIAGCHTPEQGGLRLIHRPTPDQVVTNYQATVAQINLQDPPSSHFLLAPLNGPLPSAKEGEGAATGFQVDHPDYAGRFNSTTDCCYCTILNWICSGSSAGESNAGCQACRPLAGCDGCKPIVACAPGGASEKGAENAEAFQAVATIVATRCGMCHPAMAPPSLKDAADLMKIVKGEVKSTTGEDYLTPCQSGGSFLRYVDGNNNDGSHGNALNAEERGRLHVWIEELGAPTGAGCRPGGTGAPEEQPLFEAVTKTIAESCGGCHPGMAPPALRDAADLRALANQAGAAKPYIVGCAADSLLLTYVDGNNGDPLHGVLLQKAKETAEIHEWIEKYGAPTP